MAEYAFGGEHPTHVLIAPGGVTQEEVAKVRAQIEREGYPVVLPANWRIEPVLPPEYASYPVITYPPRPDGFAVIVTALLSAFSGFIVGVAVMAALILGGII